MAKSARRKRSFGNRLKTATIIAVVSGLGVMVVLFALAWAVTEIGLGTVEQATGAVGDRSAFAAATSGLGNIPWLAGGAVAFVAFVRELADL